VLWEPESKASMQWRGEGERHNLRSTSIRKFETLYRIRDEKRYHLGILYILTCRSQQWPEMVWLPPTNRPDQASWS